MKKQYDKPFLEKIEFDYRNVIVMASGGCTGVNNMCHGTPNKPGPTYPVQENKTETYTGSNSGK